MLRWLRMLRFILDAKRKLNTKISLAAYIKFPAFVRLGENCTVQKGCMIDAPGPGLVTLGRDVGLNRNVYLGGFGKHLIIGDRTQLNHGAFVDGRGSVRIGNDVLIGPSAKLISYQHVFSDPDKPISRQGFALAEIVVEDDVWIGANAVIMAGITIGRGSVVGAGAIVTRSCEPYSIIGGVPARVIGKRK